MKQIFGGEFMYNTEKKLLAENDLCYFYQTEMTKIATDSAREKDLNSISLDGYTVVLAEQKSNGFGEFIIINSKNEVIYSNTNIEHIGAKLDMLKANKHFNR
jgi:hypothetical protein